MLFTLELDNIHKFRFQKLRLYFFPRKKIWKVFLLMCFQQDSFRDESSVQFSCSVVSNSLQPHKPTACQASLSLSNFWSLLKLMPIESMIASNHFILCCPLLLPPSIFPSIRIFSNESVLHTRWPKYWSCSFIVSPSNEYSGRTSFRMDCFDILAVQATLKSLLQHHSSKASIPRHSAFFIVQLSHPYTTTGKAIALTRWTFVDKVMSLHFICCLLLLLSCFSCVQLCATP